MVGKLRFWFFLGFALIAGAVIAYLAYLELNSQVAANVRIGGGYLNSEPYEFASAIGHVLTTNYPNIRTEIVATGGSSENIQLLAEGQLDLALVQADVVTRQNVALLAVLYPDVFQLLVRRDSGIHTVKHLEGHKVALPAITSGQYRAFWYLANQYGLAPERIQAFPMSPSQASKSISRGQVDAVFRVRGPRNRRIKNLVSTTKLRMIEIDQGEAMHLRQPAFRASTIPKGSYKGSPPIPREDLNTVAVDRLLLARADLDENVVKAATRVLFEKRRDLILRTPLATFIRQPRMETGTILPVHSGALEYYNREKPSLLEEKAEFFAFLLSFAVVLGSVFIAVKRHVEENQKGRIVDYAFHLIELEKNAKQARSIPDLNTFKDELTEILAKVVDDMKNDQISSKGLQFFAFTWESVNATINDHEEQLRLGPGTIDEPFQTERDTDRNFTEHKSEDANSADADEETHEEQISKAG